MPGRSNAVSESGYTMIEVVVSITAVIIIMGALLVGLPATRANQELRLAQQQVQSAIRDAQQRALNETRDPDCLANQSADARRVCSDAGVAFRGRDLVLFADLNRNGRYDDSSVDYRIRQESLSGVVQAVEQHNYIYRAVPPTIELVGQGASSVITLQRDPQLIRLRIQVYGHVDRQ